MQSGAVIRGIGGRVHDDEPNILTPGAEYNEDHKDWKVTRELRWIKDKLGLKTVFAFVAAVATTTLLIVQLAAPAVKQGEINGKTVSALEALGKSQEEAKAAQALAADKQAKDLSAAIGDFQASQARIEAGVNRAIGIAEENRNEMNRQTERNERRMDKISDKADAAWNWMLELKGRVQEVEAKQRKEK